MTEEHPDPPQPQEPQEPRDQDATAQPGPRDSAGESSPPPQQPESTPDPFAETAPIAGPASGDEPQAPVPPPPPPASPVPLAPPPPVAPPPPGAAGAGAWPPPPPPPPPYGAPPPGQPGQPGPPPPGYPAYGAPPPGYGYPPEIPGQKSKLVAGLLGIFLGGFGIHRFYLGYTTIGIVQIIVTVCTLGIGAIWGFIEGILILVGSTITTDAKGIPLKDS